MKFVIKSGSVVKLYSGEMKIEALAQFLKENFAGWNTNNLTYTDKDLDQISLTTQEDLDVLLATNPYSQYVKLEISQGQVQKESKEDPKETVKDSVNQPESHTLTPKDEKIQESLKKESRGSRSPKKWHDKKWREQKLKDRKKESKQTQQENPPTSSESEPNSVEKKKIKQVQNIINQKVSEMIDSRIKSLIPCLKNQLNETISVNVGNEGQQIVHEDTYCNGCNMNPIVGIRYKCLECPTFNFCSSCEQKIEHDHNLLKMKKPEPKESLKKKNREFWKIGKRLIRGMKSRGKSSESSGEKRHRWHKHCHGKGKFQNQGEFKQHRLNKKLFKLQAIFGEQNNFIEFIQKYSDLRPRELIEVYASENNIPQEELQLKRDKMRKTKLAAFYGRPQEEFDQVVKTYPQLNFREIIIKLKELGQMDYTGENFKQMRERLRKSSQEKSVPKIESKKERKSVSKPKSPKRMNSQEKKRILSSMSSLFGEEQQDQHKKFIDENASLDQEQIIAKWIEKITC